MQSMQIPPSFSGVNIIVDYSCVDYENFILPKLPKIEFHSYLKNLNINADDNILGYGAINSFAKGSHSIYKIWQSSPLNDLISLLHQNNCSIKNIIPYSYLWCKYLFDKYGKYIYWIDITADSLVRHTFIHNGNVEFVRYMQNKTYSAKNDISSALKYIESNFGLNTNDLFFLLNDGTKEYEKIAASFSKQSIIENPQDIGIILYSFYKNHSKISMMMQLQSLEKKYKDNNRYLKIIKIMQKCKILIIFSILIILGIKIIKWL